MGSEREEERERKECRDSLLLHFVCGEGSILFFCFWVPLFSIYYDFTGERGWKLGTGETGRVSE